MQVHPCLPAAHEVPVQLVVIEGCERGAPLQDIHHVQPAQRSELVAPDSRSHTFLARTGKQRSGHLQQSLAALASLKWSDSPQIQDLQSGEGCEDLNDSSGRRGTDIVVPANGKVNFTALDCQYLFIIRLYPSLFQQKSHSRTELSATSRWRHSEECSGEWPRAVPCRVCPGQ